MLDLTLFCAYIEDGAGGSNASISLKSLSYANFLLGIRDSVIDSLSPPKSNFLGRSNLLAQSYLCSTVCNIRSVHSLHCQFEGFLRFNLFFYFSIRIFPQLKPYIQSVFNSQIEVQIDVDNHFFLLEFRSSIRALAKETLKKRKSGTML